MSEHQMCGEHILLSAEALLDAQFSVAPGSAWLWHPALPCVPTAVALPRVPADGAISPCHSGLWWHGEPDGHLSPPCKNGFLSLQPNQSFPIWLIAQAWGKLCQYGGGVMCKWE